MHVPVLRWWVLLLFSERLALTSTFSFFVGPRLAGLPLGACLSTLATSWGFDNCFSYVFACLFCLACGSREGLREVVQVAFSGLGKLPLLILQYEWTLGCKIVSIKEHATRDASVQGVSQNVSLDDGVNCLLETEQSSMTGAALFYPDESEKHETFLYN